MTKPRLSATLPDGTLAFRSTFRDYKFVVAVRGYSTAVRDAKGYTVYGANGRSTYTHSETPVTPWTAVAWSGSHDLALKAGRQFQNNWPSMRFDFAFVPVNTTQEG